MCLRRARRDRDLQAKEVVMSRVPTEVQIRQQSLSSSFCDGEKFYLTELAASKNMDRTKTAQDQQTVFCFLVSPAFKSLYSAAPDFLL